MSASAASRSAPAGPSSISTRPISTTSAARSTRSWRLFPDGDGIFIDICFALPSVSTWAQPGMEAEGLDWTDPEHRLKFTEQIQIRFFERVSEAVWKHDRKKPLFFNFGHVRRGRNDMLRFFSHLEIESLPTSGGATSTFPVSARYCRDAGHPVPRHDRKVPQSLGRGRRLQETGGVPLRVRRHAGAGRRCSIGDHLHPTGALDQTTYRTRSAPAYAHVKALRAMGGGLDRTSPRSA